MPSMQLPEESSHVEATEVPELELADPKGSEGQETEPAADMGFRI